MDHRLRPVIERAAELEIGGFRQAEPGLGEREARRLADGEGGRGQDAGRHAVEQVPSQDRAHIQRCTRQGDPLRGVVRQLDPVDPGRLRLVEPRLDRIGDHLAAVLRRRQFDAGLLIFEILHGVADPGGELLQLLGDRVGDAQRLADPAVGGAPGLLVDGDPVEEFLGGVPGALGLVDGRLDLVDGEQALLRAFVVEPAQEEIDLARCDPESEVVAGDGFEGVGLVEDGDVVIRQHGRAVAPEGEVAHEQGMVHDQDVGVPHPLPGGVVEALLVRLALLAQAVAVLAGDVVPDRHLGPEVQVRPAAVGRRLRPRGELIELVEILRVDEQPAGLLAALFNRRRLT